MYETWATEVDDWDTQEYSDEQLVSILYNVGTSLPPIPVCRRQAQRMRPLACPGLGMSGPTAAAGKLCNTSMTCSILWQLTIMVWAERAVSCVCTMTGNVIMMNGWGGVHDQDDSSPESVAQNVLAIALALLLAAAVGNVVWKIVVVSWALLSAAVRYVAVAFLLLAIAVFLA